MPGESEQGEGSKPPRHLRILHVTAALAPRLGGPSAAAVEMCQALARRKLNVTLFSTDLDERGRWTPFVRPNRLDVNAAKSVYVGDVETRYFKTSWPSRFAFSPAMAWALRQRIREFDLVHAHSLYLFPTLAAVHYARQAGIPYILRPHGVLHPYHMRRHRVRKAIYKFGFEGRSLNGAAAIHYTSEDEMEMARPLRLAAPGVVAPLGVDLDQYLSLPSRGTFRRRYPALQNRDLVVFVGRLTPQKGLDLLVTAFRMVIARFPNAHLVIAGPDEGHYAGQVRRWISEAGLRGRTTLTGMLVGELKLALLADADVWVLPSHAENFGIAAVEAMASALPVVLSNRVSIHREVERAAAGLIVKADAKEVAAAICRLLEDPSLRERLGQSARQLVASEFTWDSAADRIIRIYQGIVNRPGQAIEMIS